MDESPDHASGRSMAGIRRGDISEIRPRTALLRTVLRKGIGQLARPENVVLCEADTA
jgi:hypothetical protein